MVVSPDGLNVYTTTWSAAVFNAPLVDAFARAPDGALTLIDRNAAGFGGSDSPLCGAASPIVSPDGRHVYVATHCSDDGFLHVFDRDASTGALELRPGGPRAEGDRIDGAGGRIRIALTPDGRHVYVGAYSGRTIGIFRRDATSGDLAWVGGLTLEFGKARQREIGSMAVSPDGRHVYVSHEDSLEDDDRLLVFTRDVDTGALALIQTVADGADGFAVLNDLYTIVVSADGRHVYAGPFRSGAGSIVVLERDPATGRLTVVQTLTGERRIAGTSLTMGPGGRFLFAGGQILTILRRDAVSGRLDLAEQLDDPGGSSTAVSLDERDLYVSVSRGIARFEIACGNGRLDADEACDDANPTAGDGCDPHCAVEPCFECAGDPSVCAPRDGTSCDDGNACTAAGTCAAGVCVAGTALPDGAACDDGDACTTTDVCDAGECTGADPPTCDVCSRCDRRLGCVGFLESGCFASAEVGRHGRLRMERRRSGRMQVLWRWATPKAPHTRDDLGDPTAETAYTLCVFARSERPFGFDQRRQRPVVAALRMPPGGDCSQDGCWTREEDGFRFRARGPGAAVRRARLRGGDERSKLLVKARLDAGTPGALPVALPIVAQIRSSNGTCWETAYEQFVARNDGRGFEARGGLDVPCRPSWSSSCTE
jgi:cysteine-rich repeat protein